MLECIIYRLRSCPLQCGAWIEKRLRVPNKASNFTRAYVDDVFIAILADKGIITWPSEIQNIASHLIRWVRD